AGCRRQFLLLATKSLARTRRSSLTRSRILIFVSIDDSNLNRSAGRAGHRLLDFPVTAFPDFAKGGGIAFHRQLHRGHHDELFPGATLFIAEADRLDFFAEQSRQAGVIRRSSIRVSRLTLLVRTPEPAFVASLFFCHQCLL